MNDALGNPQTAVLVGGSSDIGLATLHCLARRRLRHVVLAGRAPSGYGEAVERLRGLGVERVDAFAVDSRDIENHQKFVADVVDLVGDIDVAILAAGVLGSQAEQEADPGLAAEVLQTNFVGSASIGLYLAQRMQTQGHGKLVVLSSVAGERPRRSNFVYGASKSGLDAFFTGLADSLVGSGVRVLVVRPGFVHSKMTAGRTPVPFATTPDAVAEVIIRGLARNRETVWAPPVLRMVMLVLRHLPRAVFRRLPL